MEAGNRVRRWSTGGWRGLAVLAVSGALALSGCTQNSDTEGPTTQTTAAQASKVDSIANMVPEDIKSSGKLVVGVNVPYTPNEFKDPSGKIVGFDVDLATGLEVEDACWRATAFSPDRAEGVAAFNEKRPPRWPSSL